MSIQQDLISNRKNILRKQVINWMPVLAFVSLWIAIFQELSSLSLSYHFLDWDFWIALFFILLLVPFNLIFEALKFSVNNTSNDSIRESLVKICQGYTLKFLLPFGLGTLSGRIWNSEECDKRAQIESSILGGFMQSISNLSGMVLLAWLPESIFEPITNFISEWDVFTILSVLSFSGFIFLALFHFKKWKDWQIWQKIKPLRFLAMGQSSWSWKKLSILLAWSLMRYLIYLMQWIIVLCLIGKLSLYESVASAIVYLALLTFVVLPQAFTVVSRSIVALTLFGAFGLGPSMCIFLSCLIFLLNQVVPAMFGFLFLLKKNDG